jgi:glycosyltransferase involved in cell wall biosynthesis
MRIVMVTPQIGTAYGQEKVVFQSTELLENAGNDVFLLAECQKGALPDHRGVCLVEGVSSFHNLTHLGKVKQALSQIDRFLEKVQPDLIHLHELLDPRIVERLSLYAPLVFTAHTVAPTCPSGARLGEKTLTCNKVSGWSCLATNKKEGCLGFLKTDLHRAHAIHNYLQRRAMLLSKCESVAAISEYVSKLLVREGWPAEKIHSIPNPVVVPPFVRAETSQVPQLLFAARITPVKGLEDLLRACSALSDRAWHLTVCGEGSEKLFMEALAKQWGISKRVHFQGRLSGEALAREMSRASVFIAPNRGPETFGLSVAEACALGLPVVLSQVPGLNEIIRDESEGTFFQAGNAESLTEALKNVLDNPDRARQKARKVQSSIGVRFSKQKHLELTMDWYASVVRKPGKQMQSLPEVPAY